MGGGGPGNGELVVTRFSLCVYVIPTLYVYSVCPGFHTGVSPSLPNICQVCKLDVIKCNFLEVLLRYDAVEVCFYNMICFLPYETLVCVYYTMYTLLCIPLFWESAMDRLFELIVIPLCLK